MLLSAVFASSRAHCAPVNLALTPQTTQIGLTIYALGLFSQAARYDQFNGTMLLDPARPDFCRIDLTAQTASLTMDNPDRVKTALGPSMLDAAHFPTLSYRGACQPGGIAGSLTLHGITLPMALHARQDGNRMFATGSLRRSDYGVNGMPALVGPRIGISLTIALVPGKLQPAPP